MEQNSTRLKFSNSVEIARDPEAVFRYVSDIATHPDWSPDDVEILDGSSGPPSIGSRYRTAGFSAVRGARQEAELEVTVFDPPKRFGFTALSGGVSFENVFEFTPCQGGTRVERILSFEASPVVAEKMRNVGQQVDQRRDVSLQMLKERLERG